MAIDRPEAIDAALALTSRSAAEDGGCRPFCFAMQSTRRVRRKMVGSRHCGIGDRGAAVLRPDQAIRGRVGRIRPDSPETTWPPTAYADKGEHRRSQNDPQSRRPGIGRAAADRAPAATDGSPCSDGDDLDQVTLPLDQAPRIRSFVPACSGARSLVAWSARPRRRTRPSRLPHPERDVRVLPRQGSSPKGQNAAGGLSVADEPGPKGDAQPFFPVRYRTNVVNEPARPASCHPEEVGVIPVRAVSSRAMPPNRYGPVRRPGDCGSERHRNRVRW